MFKNIYVVLLCFWPVHLKSANTVVVAVFPSQDFFFQKHYYSPTLESLFSSSWGTAESDNG